MRMAVRVFTLVPTKCSSNFKVRYWHLADIPTEPLNVGHDDCAAKCPLGTKRTSPNALHMPAFDPKADGSPEETRKSIDAVRIRVTPKAGGDRQHVFGLRNGPTPKIGVELDVILGDRRICARVTDINLPVSKWAEHQLMRFTPAKSN